MIAGNVDWATLSIISAVIICACSTVWWLSNQFRDVRALVYTKVEQLKDMIMDKLEYHERHDDTRFSQLSNDLWSIRIRNAARDGIPVNTLRPYGNEKENS